MDVRVVEKPWGTETWIASNEHYICRILRIRKGASVSLQYHTRKVETLFIEEGSAIYTLEKPGLPRQTRILNAGEIIEHRPYEIHRQQALEDMKIIEVSTPEINDIVRLEDEYGRADPQY
jgi:mannose-6-phosphate isomerase